LLGIWLRFGDVKRSFLASERWTFGAARSALPVAAGIAFGRVARLQFGSFAVV